MSELEEQVGKEKQPEEAEDKKDSALEIDSLGKQDESNIEDVLEKIKVTNEIKEALRIVLAQRSEHFVGPIPPPELLRQYNEVMPGCAEILIEQFVAQGNHRRQLEKVVITGDVIRAYLGLAAGFLLGLFGLGGSFYVISLGHSLSGAATFITALGSLVGLFIVAEWRRRKERERKNKLVPEKPSDQ